MGETNTERWVSKTPHYANPELDGRVPPPTPCGACGSADTVCVHFSLPFACNTGYLKEIEFRCRACGRYTGFEESYDS